MALHGSSTLAHADMNKILKFSRDYFCLKVYVRLLADRDLGERKPVPYRWNVVIPGKLGFPLDVYHVDPSYKLVALHTHGTRP